MMKVYEMNDCDFVAAETEEQAKTFYAKETGFTKDEVEHDFQGEISLERKMWVEVNDLPIEEQKQAQEMKMFHGEMFTLRSLSWVIKNDKITEPCVICSKEF